MSNVTFALIVGLVLGIVSLLVASAIEGQTPAWAESITETVGSALESFGITAFSSPKIVSATPNMEADGSIVVQWSFNAAAKEKLGGSPDYKAEFIYNENPGNDFQNQRLVCTAYREEIQRTPPKVPGFNCMIPSDFKAIIGSSCTGNACADAPPGQYEIRISFKPTGKSKFEGDEAVSYKFFTKSYLEQLDKDVEGCPACNVEKCKRKALVASLDADKSANCVNDIKKIYGQVYAEFYPGPILTGPNAMTSCAYPPGELPIRVNDREVAFKDCPISGLDKLYAKAPHWTFFRSACTITGMQDESLKNVEKLFNTMGGRLGIDLAMEATLDRLSGCVSAAEGALYSSGWNFFLTDKDRKAYDIPEGAGTAPHDLVQTDISKEADSYIQSELPPVIRDFKATYEGEKISTKWTVPVGSLNIDKQKKFELLYAHRKYISDSDNVIFTSLSTDLIGNSNLKITDRAFSFTPHTKTGQHVFKLTVTAADTGEVYSTKPIDLSLWDTQYVELYRDLEGISGACWPACPVIDVIGRKEEALANANLGWLKPSGATPTPLPSGWPDTYTTREWAKLSKAGKLQASCKIDPGKKGEGRITGCTEEEVNALYTGVVTEYSKTLPKDAYPPGTVAANWLLDRTCGTSEAATKQIYVKNGIAGVCKAKSALMDLLQERKWNYIG